MKQSFGLFAFNNFCYLWYDTVPRQGKRVTEYDVIEYGKNMTSPSFFEIMANSEQYTNDMRKKYRHEPNRDSSCVIRNHRSIPLMMTGLFKTPNGWEPMGTGTYHYYNFFTHKPKDFQKLKGIYQSILDRAIQNERSKGYNLNTENFSEDAICNYDVGNLSIAQIKNLYPDFDRT